MDTVEVDVDGFTVRYITDYEGGQYGEMWTEIHPPGGGEVVIRRGHPVNITGLDRTLLLRALAARQ